MNSRSLPSNWKILPNKYFLREDAVEIAQDMIGKILITDFGGHYTGGRIVEAEAYNGITDRASHAYGNKRTKRTEVMYADAGSIYVYLCYGIHHMFNIVTNKKDIPHAILIRALEPLIGIDIMLERTGKKRLDHTLTQGPGNVTKALGIPISATGKKLGAHICIAEDGFATSDIISTPRIGVDYAGEDASLPYRFLLKGNPYVSGKKYR